MKTIKIFRRVVNAILIIAIIILGIVMDSVRDFILTSAILFACTQIFLFGFVFLNLSNSRENNKIKEEEFKTALEEETKMLIMLSCALVVSALPIVVVKLFLG